MANQSIYNAFERMWFHINEKFSEFQPGEAIEAITDEEIDSICSNTLTDFLDDIASEEVEF